MDWIYILHACMCEGIVVLYVYLQAATDGNAEILQELIFKFGQVSVSHDSLINMYNTLGYTMLHYAVMYKQLNCITTLIELGAGKLTTLMIARVTIATSYSHHLIQHRMYSYMQLYMGSIHMYFVL